MSQNRRLVERLEDPGFLDGIEGKSLDELRALRAECNEGELELSFERRLCQARIDILSAEIEQRHGGESGSLVERLPEILARDSGGERSSRSDQLPFRAPASSIPRNASVQRRRVEEIVGEQALARLSDIPEEELRTLIQSLGDHEAKLSERRKRIHEVVDRVQEEIVKRYTSGQADPSKVLP